jgi:hypothetical protein
MRQRPLHPAQQNMSHDYDCEDGSKRRVGMQRQILHLLTDGTRLPKRRIHSQII